MNKSLASDIRKVRRDAGYEPESRHRFSNRPVAFWIVRILDGYLNDRHVIDFVPEHQLEGNEDAVV